MTRDWRVKKLMRDFFSSESILLCVTPLLGLYPTAFAATCMFRRSLSTRGLFFTLGSFLFISFLGLIACWEAIMFKKMTLSSVVAGFSSKFFGVELALAIRVDGISYLFLLLVVGIGLAAHLYTHTYMCGEAQADVFFLQLHAFIISMVYFLCAANGVTLLLGWEFIGLTSYFLINFWSPRPAAIKAALKAFVFNKVSDVFLLFSLACLSQSAGCLDFLVIEALVLQNKLPYTDVLYWGVTSLVICACFKSAQIGFHVWLPDSMEAPVPASALIHSATLVSAGVYLLIRFTPLIAACDLWPVVQGIGAVTAVFGGVVAAAQTDLKRLLAYSTISHCGFLFVSVSLQNTYVIFIYLYLHGIMKAACFFAVGAIIRGSGGQDNRRMGQLSRILPVDSLCLIIGGVNLGGLPGTLGYIYKEAFLSSLLESSVHWALISLLFVGMWSGAVYTYRLVYYTLFDTSKQPLPICRQWFFRGGLTAVNEVKVSGGAALPRANLFCSMLLLAQIFCWALGSCFNDAEIELSGALADVAAECELTFFGYAVDTHEVYVWVLYAGYLIVAVVYSLVEHRTTFTKSSTRSVIVFLCALGLCLALIVYIGFLPRKLGDVLWSVYGRYVCFTTNSVATILCTLPLKGFFSRLFWGVSIVITRGPWIPRLNKKSKSALSFSGSYAVLRRRTVWIWNKLLVLRRFFGLKGWILERPFSLAVIVAFLVTGNGCL